MPNTMSVYPADTKEVIQQANKIAIRADVTLDTALSNTQSIYFQVAFDNKSVFVEQAADSTDKSRKLIISIDKKRISWTTVVRTRNSLVMPIGDLGYTVSAIVKDSTAGTTPPVIAPVHAVAKIVASPMFLEGDIEKNRPQLLSNEVIMGLQSGETLIEPEKLPKQTDVYYLFRVSLYNHNTPMNDYYTNLFFRDIPSREHSVRFFEQDTAGGLIEIPFIHLQFYTALMLQLDAKGSKLIRVYPVESVQNQMMSISPTTPSYEGIGSIDGDSIYFINDETSCDEVLEAPDIAELAGGHLEYKDGYVNAHGKVGQYQNHNDRDVIIPYFKRYNSSEYIFLETVTASVDVIDEYVIDIPYANFELDNFYQFKYFIYDGSNISRSYPCLFKLTGDNPEVDPPTENVKYPAPAVIWSSLDGKTDIPIGDNGDENLINKRNLEQGTFKIRAFITDDTSTALPKGTMMNVVIQLNGFKNGGRDKNSKTFSLPGIVDDASITNGFVAITIPVNVFSGFDSDATDNPGKVWAYVKYDVGRGGVNSAAWHCNIDTVAPGELLLSSNKKLDS